MYSIREVSEKFNVSVRTIRYYESIGLISKGLRKSGVRFFEKSIISKEMKEIIFLKSLDYSINTIKEILCHPFYIREVCMNIKLHLLHLEAKNISLQTVNLRKELRNKKWPIAKVSNDDVLKILEINNTDIFSSYIDIKKENTYSRDEIKEFIDEFKLWFNSSGICINEEHIQYLHQTKAIEDISLKKIFDLHIHHSKKDNKSDLSN